MLKFGTEMLIFSRSTSYISSYMNVFAPPSAFVKAAVACLAFEELHL